RNLDRITYHSRIRAILKEYELLADGGIIIDFVDYIRDSDTALKISDQYGIALTEDILIVDAAPSIPGPPPATDGSEPDSPKIAELRQSHVRFIAVKDMRLYTDDQRTGRRPSGYQEEDQLTSAIRRALEGNPRRFYFLSDKSQIGGSGEDAPWDFLRRTFEKLNINLIPIRVSGLQKIPEDAAGIALVAPRFDLNTREMAVFREYWERPRAAALIILDPNLKQQPSNLRAFLREHGVTPRAVRLSTSRGNQEAFDIPTTFTNAPALGDLRNASTLFEGASSSLELRENAEDLELRQIVPLALIETGNSVQAQPLDGSDPVPGPHYLASSVSRGNERNDNTAGETSRMIVVSNTDFLKPRSRHKEHIDFLRNTSNWLIGREELSGIGPKQVRYYKLLLTPQKVSFVNQLNLIFVPGLFLLVSLLVWNARRA
ncbi:MAG: Gldg family protein, partial [Verrucomicrobiota bacterium]|nr:Gldg family protein [Verrucomicrobiota bacterium]